MIAEDIPIRDPVDATKSLDIDGDCPSRLVDSGFLMRVGDIIECSVELSNASVDVGSNEVAGDLVTLKVDSIALDGSVVTSFTFVVVGAKSVMDGRVITGETLVDSPVSLTGSLAETDGTIIEGIAEGDELEYSVADISNEISTIVEAILVGEVLEYSVVDRDRGIEDSRISGYVVHAEKAHSVFHSTFRFLHNTKSTM